MAGDLWVAASIRRMAFLLAVAVTGLGAASASPAAAQTALQLASPPSCATRTDFFNERACNQAMEPYAAARRNRLQQRMWDADHPPTPQARAYLRAMRGQQP